MKTLILGGTGNAGKTIARHLLQQTEMEVVIGGRNKNHNLQILNWLETTWGISTNRLSTVEVDAENVEGLKHAFKRVDFVIVASSTTEYLPNILQAALVEKKDYLDISLPSPEKTACYQKNLTYILDNGLCIITDGGFHPGVPAALVRYAGLHIPTLERAEVGGLLKPDWGSLNFSDNTALEFLQEIRHFDPEYWENGSWQKSYYKKTYFDFTPPFGRQVAMPMMMEEMRSLPNQFPSLQQCGFFIAGFDKITDNVVLPLILMISGIFGKMFDRPLSKWMLNSLKKHAEPPFRSELLMLAEGIRNGERTNLKIRLGHHDAYELTAIPVVACVLQYLTRERKPGLFYQAQFVQPEAFLSDLQRIGLELEIETKNEKLVATG